VAVAGLAAGLWAGDSPTAGLAIKFALAGLLMVCGLALLSPAATIRPSDESQRKTRRRVSAMGAGFVMMGVAQLVPGVGAHLALFGVTLLLLVGAATGWPNRVFAPRS
jgi:hypothetical protein